MNRWFKQLFCFHLNWTDQATFKDVGEIKKTGIKDWRTNSSYWECSECGKVKMFSFDFIPINFGDK